MSNICRDTSVIPETFSFIPAYCSRVLTYDESMSIAISSGITLKIQFYIYATKGHLFLDRVAIENLLLRQEHWLYTNFDQNVNLYINCLKDPRYHDFFNILKERSERAIQVFKCH